MSITIGSLIEVPAAMAAGQHGAHVNLPLSVIDGDTELALSR